MRLPRLTLQSKAFIALAAMLALLLVLFAGFSRWALQRGLGPYVAEIELARMDWLAERLQNQYAQTGSWAALRAQPALWRQLHRFGRQRPGGPPPPGTPGAPPRFDAPPGEPQGPGQRPGPPPEGDAGPDGPVYGRLGLIDAQGQPVAGTAPRPGSARLALRAADGAPIGHLVLAPPEPLQSEADRALLAQHLGFMVWTGVAGLLLALLLSAWITRRWLAPVHALADGARAVASGRLDTRVPVAGDDELAQLAHTFNGMARQLAELEASRRQWLGDVAHELRTPLAAMRAEIEALQDGIRPFDDKAALRLHRQVMRLIQLVGDLRASLDGSAAASTAHHVPVHPLALLAEALAATQARFAQAGITVDAAALALPGPEPLVLGDAQQLHQVFGNLLENSLRYTAAGGRLQLSAATERSHGRAWLQLRWDDSAPGVAAHELPRLFERLYRADSARTRAAEDGPGGSGLGLAICRTIVQAHGGQIAAQPSPLGGLRITLTLPLLENTP
jgi:two-component system sensor histidine kinase BaeS